ncbi:MAG: PCRF domain-containing protein, partial [Leptospiraceae bacterium]|nr:PCRF domain-containing protein [Leptospiraceae bacterium]
MEIRPAKELIKLSKEILENFQKRWKSLNLQTDYDRMLSYEEQAKDPALWENSEKALQVTKTKTELERKLAPWLEIRQEIHDFPDLVEMTLEEEGEAGLEHLNRDYERLSEKLEDLELLGALNGPDDSRGAFFNIHPGAGGTESQDWAEMLFRMYSRYFQK